MSAFKKPLSYVNPEFATKSQNNNSRAFYRPFVVWGAAFAGTVMILAAVFAGEFSEGRYDQVLSQIKGRSEIQAQSKAQILSTWVEGLTNMGNHITDAQLVRLFATEMQLAGKEKSHTLSKSLTAQLPYMQQVMREYVAQNKLKSAFLLNAQGDVYLGSSVAKPITERQRVGVISAYRSRNTVILPLHMDEGTYVLDVIKPIFMMENDESAAPVVGVLLSQVNVQSKLVDFLAEGPLSLEGERAMLVQHYRDTVEHVTLTDAAEIKPVEMPVGDSFDEAVTSYFDGKDVFSSMAHVMKTPFAVVQEFEKSFALAPYHEYRTKVTVISFLAVMTFSACILALIWYLMGQRNRQRVRIQEQTMQALVKAVEIRDSYLFGHHARMARLALDIAGRMGLSVFDRSTLFYAAQLSSIGKIFIPSEILTKPAPLTEQERWQLQGHIKFTMEVLSDLAFDYPVKEAIECMNERMDGSGYPEALEGDEINKLSRILAVSDVYCALTEPRSYREERTKQEAVDLLYKEARKYDVEVLDTLAQIINVQPSVMVEDNTPAMDAVKAPEPLVESPKPAPVTKPEEKEAKPAVKKPKAKKSSAKKPATPKTATKKADK